MIRIDDIGAKHNITINPVGVDRVFSFFDDKRQAISRPPLNRRDTLYAIGHILYPRLKFSNVIKNEPAFTLGIQNPFFM
jgi:hypothetical protein